MMTFFKVLILSQTENCCMLKLSYNANEIADLESVQKPFMANAVIVKKLSD